MSLGVSGGPAETVSETLYQLSNGPQMADPQPLGVPSPSAVMPRSAVTQVTEYTASERLDPVSASEAASSSSSALASPESTEAVSGTPYQRLNAYQAPGPQPLAVPRPSAPPPVVSTSVVTQVAAGTGNERPDAVTVPDGARTNNSTGTLASLDPADISRRVGGGPAEAFSGTLAAQLNASSSPRLDTLVGAVGFRFDGQGVAAARSGVWTVREGEGFFAVPDSPSSVSQQPTAPSVEQPSVAAPEGEKAEYLLPQPLPQVSGVLSVLPALERGMKHFLEQLQGVGDNLAGTRDATGLGIWVVAGTAAAAACEIARRQLRRPTGGLALDLIWMTGSPPDHLYGE